MHFLLDLFNHTQPIPGRDVNIWREINDQFPLLYTQPPVPSTCFPVLQ